MDIQFVFDGIDAVVIDNFYDESEFSLVLEECISLLPMLRSADDTSSAVDIEGNNLKKNSGVFIDSPLCNIECFTKDKIKSHQLKDEMLNTNSLYKVFFGLNKFSTLISYYKDGDSYKPHVDDSIYTVLVYVHKTPKKFTGGELILNSYIDGKYATIECINNRAIIFPSITPHSVTRVNLEKDSGEDGRFCISQFVHYESVK